MSNKLQKYRIGNKKTDKVAYVFINDYLCELGFKHKRFFMLLQFLH
jgi:hypothetical protein